VNQVKDHNKSFTVTNYNIPKVAWHIVKEKMRVSQALTVAEQGINTRYEQMISEKRAEKART